jgi:glycosyltransferase involved in cell wall biosynthesis
MGELHTKFICLFHKVARMNTPRWLTAIPIFNEAKHVLAVLDEVRRFSPDILVVNDGSTDGTATLLDQVRGIMRVDHPLNRGYGAAIASAFEFAIQHQYDWLVTMDCDGQHEPSRVPVLLEAAHDCDLVSGSRYLRDFKQDTPAPSDRRFINARITHEINSRFGLDITDSFCGFKAYRVESLKQLMIDESGWGMPLQLWVQAARLGWRIKEIAVPRLYLDPNRAFGGVLNDPSARLNYYRELLDRAEASFSATLTTQCHWSACPRPL